MFSLALHISLAYKLFVSMLYTDHPQVNKTEAGAGKLISQITNSSSSNRDAIPWRTRQYWLTRSHPALPSATNVAEVFQRIKPYLISSYFLIRYNLVTGMPKLSRSQHSPEENKILHQAPEGHRTRYRNETAKKWGFYSHPQRLSKLQKNDRGLLPYI